MAFKCSLPQSQVFVIAQKHFDDRSCREPTSTIIDLQDDAASTEGTKEERQCNAWQCPRIQRHLPRGDAPIAPMTWHTPLSSVRLLSCHTECTVHTHVDILKIIISDLYINRTYSYIFYLVLHCIKSKRSSGFLRDMCPASFLCEIRTRKSAKMTHCKQFGQQTEQFLSSKSKSLLQGATNPRGVVMIGTVPHIALVG